MLLVDAVEESANVTLPAEIASGELYGMTLRSHNHLRCIVDMLRKAREPMPQAYERGTDLRVENYDAGGAVMQPLRASAGSRRRLGLPNEDIIPQNLPRVESIRWRLSVTRRTLSATPDADGSDRRGQLHCGCRPVAVGLRAFGFQANGSVM